MDNDLLNSELKDSLLDVFPLAGLKQTVNNCTRQVKNQRPSLIYHSWTSNMTKHIKTCTIDTESDHDLVMTSLLTKGTVRNEETVIRRNFSKFSKEDFVMDLMGLKWSEIYDIKDPTLIDTAITDRIISVLDLHAPTQTYRSGGKKNVGNKKLSKDCLYRISNRNFLRRKARRTNLSEDWESWKTEKN